MKGKTLFAIIALLCAAIMCTKGFTQETALAAESEKLNLNFDVKIEYQMAGSSSWNTVASKKVDGIGGIQYHNDPIANYRMTISIQKPHDLKGAFRVRMVTRSDGIVLPLGATEASITFGPHDGCSGPRCDPLTMDDVGLVEARVDLEKAQATSFGVFTLRPYSLSSIVTIRPSLKYDGKQIPCGSKVKKGFWIFAKNLTADGTPIDTISLCVLKPNGKSKCAKDQSYELDLNTSRKGAYVFSMWDSHLNHSVCEVHAS